jgi:predicted transcriptional regulator
MSVKALNWARNVTGIKSSDKCVLFVLADRANEQGVCYPGVERIAREACLNRRSVRRCVQRLSQAGLVEVIIRGGNGTGRMTNLYQLNLETQQELQQVDTESVIPKRTTCQEQQDNSDRQEVIKSPKAKDKPKVKPKKRARPISKVEGSPENLNIDAWGKYERYRKESGYKKLTTEGKRLSQQKLSALNKSDQLQVVDMSIANGWKGLFPEKIGAQNGAHQPRDKVLGNESFREIHERNRRRAGL